MNVFNSLGSNYSWGFALKNLFTIGSKNSLKQLESEIGHYYSGVATATYKGREALELALRRSNVPTGSTVGISGFTCYALYHAVEDADYKPLPIDVAKSDLQFSLAELKSAHEAYPLGAIIIQNTLGYPVDMARLEDYCQQKSILIIEDLAHSVGTHYADKREAGTVGAFTMLSFSQDKPVDVVAGGMLIDRRKKTEDAAESLPFVPLRQRTINRLYPLISGLIRLLYPVELGRGLHYLLKRLKLMATPMSDNLHGLHTMTPSTAKILLPSWRTRDAALKHRQIIAGIYEQELPATMKFNVAYGTSSYLRFPIKVVDRANLLSVLKQKNIYIGDTWYDAPIAPKKYLSKTGYKQGDCPRSEKLSELIINLPTHRYITPEKARLICATIKQCQQKS